jgi:hypothetical protein
VGSRASLDGCGKSHPHQESIPIPYYSELQNQETFLLGASNCGKVKKWENKIGVLLYTLSSRKFTYNMLV